MRFPLITAAALAALALTGCQTTGTERPTEAPPVSPETPQAVETPDSAPDVTVVDVSPGGAVETDPLWTGLQSAAGSEAYLDVHIHSNQSVADGDTTTLTPSTPNSVSVTVPTSAVDDSAEPFLRLTGTFAVEEVGSAAYTLTTEDDEEIPELRPEGPDTEERCTADDANERIMQAAQTLADDPDSREDMRLLWTSAPEVWWGIQLTALSLRDSGGEVAGDYLVEACGAYLE